MASKTFQLQTPTCQDCSGKIVDTIQTMHGVETVVVDHTSNQVTVACQTADCQVDAVGQAIEKLGFKVATE